MFSYGCAGILSMLSALSRRVTYNVAQLLTHAHHNTLHSDVNKVETGMSDKLGSFLQYSGMCVGGFAVGFAYSWQVWKAYLAFRRV